MTISNQQWQAVSEEEHLKSIRDLKLLNRVDPGLMLYITSSLPQYSTDTLLVHPDGTCYQCSLTGIDRKQLHCHFLEPTISGNMLTFPNLCPDLLFQLKKGTRLYSKDGSVRIVRVHCEVESGISVAMSSVKSVDLFGIQQKDGKFQFVRQRLSNVAQFKYLFQHTMLSNLI